MSIENSIDKLTAALDRNTEALDRHTGILSAQGGNATRGAPGDNPLANIGMDGAQQAQGTKAKNEPKNAKPAKDKPAAKAAEPVEYKTLAAKLLEVGQAPNLGRAGVVGLLKRFGAAKGSDIKPEQYAEAIEAADALLAQGDDVA